MRNYTVRYAHLESLSSLEVRSIVHKGDKLCRMGSTGQSDADHLHIDLVEGLITKIIRLSEIGYESSDVYKPNIKQLNYFIDSELFDIEPVVTTPFYDPEYARERGKDHPAYDIVPEDRKKTKDHYNIYWNRSMPGVVLGKGSDGGYGYYLLIGYET